MKLEGESIEGGSWPEESYVAVMQTSAVINVYPM